MTDLITLSTKELVAIHNGLAEALDQPTLKSWKNAKSKLIERIETLRAQDGLQAVDEPIEVKAEEACPLEADDDGPSRTIKAASIDYLCEVVKFEDRNEKSGPDNIVSEDHPGARSVGRPYDEIIDLLHAEFSGCNTSVACLRWYAVKIRVEEHGYEGLRLPQRRPRAKPNSK